MNSEKKNIMLNKYTTNTNPDIKEEKKNYDLFEGFSKPKKKSYTPVRIEDDIMEDYKEYCRVNQLVSHGVIMNEVLRDFIKNKL